MASRNVTFYLGKASGMNLDSRKYWLYKVAGSGVDETSPTAIVSASGVGVSANVEVAEVGVPSNCLIELQVQDTVGGNVMPKRYQRFKIGARGEYKGLREGSPLQIVGIDDMSSTSSQSSSSQSSSNSSSSQSSSSQSSSSSSST